MKFLVCIRFPGATHTQEPATLQLPGEKLGCNDRVRERLTVLNLLIISLFQSTIAVKLKTAKSPARLSRACCRLQVGSGWAAGSAPCASVSLAPWGMAIAKEQKEQVEHADTLETCPQSWHAVTSAKESPKVKGQRRTIHSHEECLWHLEKGMDVGRSEE